RQSRRVRRADRGRRGQDVGRTDRRRLARARGGANDTATHDARSGRPQRTRHLPPLASASKEKLMRVTFYKVDEGRLCSWTATTPKGKPFQGTTMASGSNLPHNLAQFVVEATLGFEQGFWGLLANGATFESVVGRRRTKPGRQLVRAHHDA